MNSGYTPETISLGSGREIEFMDQKVWLTDIMKKHGDRKPSKRARISFGGVSEGELANDNRSLEEDIRLTRYLLWKRHTSPFEFIEFEFLLRTPLYVARQIHRHRTASINEISRRYTSDDVQLGVFEFREKDSSITKQGSGLIILYDGEKGDLYDRTYELMSKQVELYYDMIDKGIAAETARQVLPQNMMTLFYWKIDLHNLLHFLDLRLDIHSQKEIRELAEMIYDHVKEQVPAIAEAFEDYRKMKSRFMDIGYKWFSRRKAQEFITLLEDLQFDKHND